MARRQSWSTWWKKTTTKIKTVAVVLAVLIGGFAELYRRFGGELQLPLPNFQTSETPLPAQDQTGLVSVYFSQVWDSPAANRTNPNSIAHHCVKWIETARERLDVCGFEIDNQLIVDAILRASQRGVKVRVVTDGDYAEELGPVQFQQAGIPVVVDNRNDLMHNKFLVIDGKTVWTGSFNFTENCAYKNNNNGIVIQDHLVAANFTEKFRWFWKDRKFGGKPSKAAAIPNPVVKLADGTIVETYFSTHDDVDEKVIAAIKKARQSIKFLAFSFTHDDIAAAMLERAARGVRVEGVFETRQLSSHSEFETLDHRQNIRVLPDGNPFNMHHKVIVIDDRIVVTGSFNFSASATKGNDENLVIIHNQDVARRYAEEFARVSQAASPAATASRPNTGFR